MRTSKIESRAYQENRTAQSLTKHKHGVVVVVVINSALTLELGTISVITRGHYVSREIIETARE